MCSHCFVFNLKEVVSENSVNSGFVLSNYTGVLLKTKTN